jgi:hypothetical protein
MLIVNPSALGTEKRFSDGDPNLLAPSFTLPKQSSVFLQRWAASCCFEPLFTDVFLTCKLRAAFYSISLCNRKH